MKIRDFLDVPEKGHAYLTGSQIEPQK